MTFYGTIKIECSAQVSKEVCKLHWLQKVDLKEAIDINQTKHFSGSRSQNGCKSKKGVTTKDITP